MVVLPKKASSVILLRDTPKGVETFLIQRHVASSFMGGLYAFPGGNLEVEDFSEELLAHVEGIGEKEAWAILGRKSSPQIALAHWVTGIREVFEEVGVLFASDGVSNPISFEEEKRRRAFERYRELLNKGEITFSELCRKENLTVAAHNLIHYSHWITPEAREKRYDTHFFMALVPEGQIPSVDKKEITAGIWLTPQQALKANISGDIPLTPPALCMLEELAPFSSAEDIIGFARERNMSDPILPILTTINGYEVLLLPGDKFYTAYGGKEKRNYNNLDQSVRLIQKQGRWFLSSPVQSDT
jgi:8-oxo-dGTP pyrophosphatase MutT (NUDIX family)